MRTISEHFFRQRPIEFGLCQPEGSLRSVFAKRYGVPFGHLGGGSMAVKEGGKAPAFSLVSDSGKKVKLSDFKGKTVVLYFYPKDLTSGCTVEACDFRDNLGSLKKKKAVVLGVSRDPVARHEKFRDKYELNFPLLADETGKVCKDYGVWKEKSLYGRKFMGIERTTFVIDGKGKIKKIFPKVKVKGHVEEVLGAL